jgi:hypothetical protein
LILNAIRAISIRVIEGIFSLICGYSFNTPKKSAKEIRIHPNFWINRLNLFSKIFIIILKIYTSKLYDKKGTTKKHFFDFVNQNLIFFSKFV